MRLLLDTHVALWALTDPDALSERSREAISGAAELHVSVVSPWELVIKAALGRIELHRSAEEICTELQRAFGVRLLAVNLAHVLEVGRLPPHHADPFDRLLLAQARVEGLTLLSRDSAFEAYGVDVILA
jgi:PIN domain nuclease of toxin-antitoxin system